jgi:cation transport protein ChaC
MRRDVTGCDGLAFRLAADTVDHETFVLFRREMITDGYRPVWLALDTADGPLEALSFAADHACQDVRPGIPLEEQARMIAIAQGFLGTNVDYLANVRAHLHHLGVCDSYVDALWSLVAALRDHPL